MTELQMATFADVRGMRARYGLSGEWTRIVLLGERRMINNANPHGPTGNEAAFIVGVSRRTIHRWIAQGRLSYPITYAALQGLAPRRRGPQRNPLSRRYHEGRHTWRERG